MFPVCSHVVCGNVAPHINYHTWENLELEKIGE